MSSSSPSGGGPRRHRCRSPSLSYPLRTLYALNGALMLLPNLALMFIANDRASLAPALLPAYGALAFLPWSLKPLYAALTTSLVDRRRYLSRPSLLAILLALCAASFAGTAAVPAGGVAACFAWGAVRGLASAWPEFLLGLTLIDEARAGSDPSEEEEDGEDAAPHVRSYQELSSVFQSQAATARNVGSILAGSFTFALFAWRRYQSENSDSSSDEQRIDSPAALSDAVVTFLLLTTATLPLIGSGMVLKYGVSATRDKAYCAAPLGAGQGPFGRGAGYGEVATTDDPTSEGIDSGSGRPDGESYPRQAPPFSWSYVAALVSFQLLLIVAVLEDLIGETFSHGVWLAALLTLSACLVVSLAAAAAARRRQRSRCVTEEAVGASRSTDQVPPKSLALFLLLRHSLPGSGYVFYSYLFSLFESDPLYMQCMSMLGSAGALLTTWFYGRYLAERCSSGWGIVRLIVATTAAASLASLLNLVIIRDPGGWDLRLLTAPIYFVTGVTVELNFMPSLVLATANIVSSDAAPSCRGDRDGRGIADGGGGGDEWGCVGDVPDDGDGGAGEFPLDEGMQYASFVSCINFGEQVASWISVPIVAAYGITRENGWANLDHLVVLCAGLQLASLPLLYLIRPSPCPKGGSVALTGIATGVFS